MIKRALDISLSLALLALLSVPLALIALAVKLTSPGPSLYWSDRVGRNNVLFRMPKFRSMKTSTPELATHLLQDAQDWITPVGLILRKTSLDELPQLWSILRGEMSFVGPRPALHNQQDLVALRTACGVQRLLPGLTGWAQINGRDELPIAEKVELDKQYLERRSLGLDLQILVLTVFKALRAEGVRQGDPLTAPHHVGAVDAEPKRSAA